MAGYDRAQFTRGYSNEMARYGKDKNSKEFKAAAKAFYGAQRSEYTKGLEEEESKKLWRNLLEGKKQKRTTGKEVLSSAQRYTQERLELQKGQREAGNTALGGFSTLSAGEKWNLPEGSEKEFKGEGADFRKGYYRKKAQ